MSDNRSGAWGEAQARRYLRLRGWRIVETNYSCRFGEIDLIARRGEILAFVEVKTRKSERYGEAREFVTVAKQQRIVATASMYLQEHPSELQPRFDVIEVYAPAGLITARPRIHHIEDAFC
jgi:putative endonuclease